MYALVLVLLAGISAPALAQPKGGKKDPPPKDNKDKKEPKAPVLDFDDLNFQARLRTPQLLYFLDRASEELERASLERRSFIPEMVKSIDEEDL